MTQPILMDVDTGVDDALALIYLLASQEAEIVAITCTAGNVPARQVAANNLAILELCNAGDIEVALGSDVPLVEPLQTTESTHGGQGLGYSQLPISGRALSARSAVEVWVSTVRERPGEVIGVVTGPMTNLALAVRLEPELPRLLKRLVVMGGSFEHAGNVTATAEWNIAVDPEAAKIVFDAFGGLPEDRLPLVCGLNITESIVMTPAHLDKLAVLAGDPDARTALPKFLADAIRFYFEFHESVGAGYVAFMHDPLAAALAIHPELATARAATVDVELAGTLTRGATIADWTGRWGRPTNAAVVTKVSPDLFFDRLIDRIARLARELQPKLRM